MQAVVSGRAAVALVNQGGSWHAIHYAQLHRLVPCQPPESSMLLRDTHDLFWLEDVSIEQLKNHLCDAVDSTEGLDLVLYLLDPKLRPRTRDSAAREFEELAVYPEIIRQIEQVLLAAPFPESTDIPGAIAACERTESPLTRKLVLKWTSLQNAVSQVCDAWRGVNHEPFGSFDYWEYVKGVCIRNGVFSELVHEIFVSTPIGEHFFRRGKYEELRKELPIIGSIFSEWQRALESQTPSSSTAVETVEFDVERKSSFRVPTAILFPKRGHKAIYTTGEVARICGVSQQTIIRCFESGQLKGFRVPGSRFRRIPFESLYKFMKENGIPTDALDSELCKVLLVDDDEELVELIREALDVDRRFEFRAVNNGFDAGMIVKEYHPAVIVVDVMLPDVNGKEVCQRIRGDRTLDDVKIICISGFAERSAIANLLSSGANTFMQKPFEVVRLIDVICDLLDMTPITVQ